MRISTERINEVAATSGFRAEIVEKVIRLLSVLNELREHQYLQNRLALKGGTALNLFVFDIPRLSVDIDLNYLGSADRDTMLAERPGIERAITAVCGRLDLGVLRQPDDHAGGKWRLRYQTSAAQAGNLELDLNFMYRRPLWSVGRRDSRPFGSYEVQSIPVLDVHELAAGKLAALFSRHAGRDLFDVHQLLTGDLLDRGKLRLAFIVYGAMSRKDWRTVDISDVGFEPRELRETLLPVLKTSFLESVGDFDTWAKSLVEECRSALDVVLPLSDNERDFLDRLLDCGEVEPSLLTSDTELAERIRTQPMLLWKAQNVREFSGPSDGDSK